MAIDNKAPNKGAVNKAADEDFALEAPEGAIDVSTGRSMYKADLCHDWPIQGYLIAAEQLEGKGVGVFTGLIFRLTKACKTPDSKGVLVTRRSGEEIILPMTFELNGLDETAQVEHEVVEFWLKPTEKETLASGHTLWHYKLKFIRKAPRSTIATKALFAGTTDAPQLQQQASA